LLRCTAGINIPWHDFGNDVGGSYDGAWFDAYFAGAARNGSNVARWWLHADGRGGLLFQPNGSIAGLKPTFLTDLAALAALAKQHQVVLQVCLWSFDMCKTSEFQGQVAHADLITDIHKTQSYITQALQPLLRVLTSVLGTGGALVEVINEPEWCMAGLNPGISGACQTDVCVPPKDMQRFVGTIAEAVHSAGLKVTLGSASLKWNAEGGSALGNWWSDRALMSAVAGGGGGGGGGGGPAGSGPTLDHYQIHYCAHSHSHPYYSAPC
jgi:hypothetical protein